MFCKVDKALVLCPLYKRFTCSRYTKATVRSPIGWGEDIRYQALSIKIQMMGSTIFLHSILVREESVLKVFYLISINEQSVNSYQVVRLFM